MTLMIFGMVVSFCCRLLADDAMHGKLYRLQCIVNNFVANLFLVVSQCLPS